MEILRLRCAHTSRKMNTTIAEVSNTKQSLDVCEATLDWDEIERTKGLMKNDGKYVYLNMPAGTTESITKENPVVSNYELRNKENRERTVGQS